MDWVLPKSIGDMMIISFRGSRTSIKGKTFGKSLASIYFGLCGKRYMLGFLRKGGEWRCGIYFTSIPPHGPFIPSLLKGVDNIESS